MRKPTVLILYANYGAGHKRAADAIEEKLQASFQEDQVMKLVKEDFLGKQFPLIDGFMRKLYIQSFKWAKPFYRRLYYKTKELPIDSSVTSFFTYLGSKKLEKYIREVKADIVISTFPALTGMLSQIKKRNQTSFKLCCLLTDYTTHNHWLYEYVDHYFVPTEKIKNEFIEKGIPKETVEVTGIPVLNQFETKKEISQLKEEWGLEHTKPTVLISAGAFGVTDLKSLCVNLKNHFPTFQFIVVCGRNQSLFDYLSKVEGIRAIGFTDKMDELLQVTDLFISKAGGLSVSEAIATETPMLLFGSLPGQETENVAFLTEQQVAKEAKNEQELIQWLEVLYSNNEASLHQMKDQIKELKRTIKHDDRWLRTIESETKIYQFSQNFRPATSLLSFTKRFFKIRTKKGL